MNLRGIDHVAIAVRDLDEAVETYGDLLGVDPHYEKVHDQGVRLAAFEVGDSRIELITPLNEDSGLNDFLEREGEGIHHLAFRTDDLSGELNRVRDIGIDQIDTEPRNGAEGYEIAFLHPKSLNGTLVELAQPPQE